MRQQLVTSLALWAVFSTVPLHADERLTFEADVRPLFKARCFHCHGEAEELAGGLDLRLKRLAVRGGDAGASIVPEKSGESYLIDRLRDGEMPPEGHGEPLSTAEIDRIARWIDQGAPTARPEPQEIGHGMLITEEDRQFWSFQPIRRPDIPDVGRVSDPSEDGRAGDPTYNDPSPRLANPIDAFVLAKLEEAGLSFSPPADRRTLIRRAYFDLIGLPPAPEEVAAFLADDSPDAWARLIDRLLASPHYGERWGRHWLDVAGYADSEGVTGADTPRLWAFAYRDYVIRSLNADKPFDEFIREQLAGDELIGKPPTDLSPADVERLAATGYLRMAPDGTADKSIDPTVSRNQVVADTVEIVTSSLLAMTVKCAQCHEHRYDPIPQADYYRLRAIFEPALNPKDWRTPPARLVSLYTDTDRAQAAKLETEAKQIEEQRLKRQAEFIEATFRRELAQVPEADRSAVEVARNTPVKKRSKEQAALLQKYPSVNVTAGSLYLFDRKAADELKQLAAEAAAIRAKKPQQTFLRALTEPAGPPPETFVFHRGDPDQPSEAVEPAGLTILASSSQTPLPIDDPDLPTTGRRLAFAQELTTGEHPLVTRVLVNRVWLHHFGQGLVDTPGDFGRLGSQPSHPELLDWLATEFVRRGWSLKELHRLMMTSTVYRQRSGVPDSNTSLSGSPHSALRTPLSTDPDNRLLWRMNLRRLDAETLRDSMLSVSGDFNAKPFGPPVPVMADLVGQWVIGKENLNAGRPGAVIPMNGEEFRRSVYVQVRRSRPLAMLETFDWPRMEPNCAQRSSSTVATQSLMLMNGDFPLTQSEHFADRLIREVGDEPAAQIRQAWQLAFSREPTADELADADAFLAAQSADMAKMLPKGKNPQRQALASLCQILFASNEFLSVD